MRKRGSIKNFHQSRKSPKQNLKDAVSNGEIIAEDYPQRRITKLKGDQIDLEVEIVTRFVPKSKTLTPQVDKTILTAHGVT